MDFLKSVAKYYIRQLPIDEWNKTVFVFPNHRSSIFFTDAVSRQLAVLERAGKPHVIFGLNTTTLGDLIVGGSGLRMADQVTLHCELYDAYKSTLADGEPMRFETFYTWAGVIINDFEDIDKNLASAGAVYRNVTEWQKLSDDLSYISDRQRKAIEDFWKIEFTEEETVMGDKRKVHRRFVDAYGQMEELYSRFRDRLRLKGLAYPGMVYRDAVEKADGNAWDEDGKRYVFIGFSLLCRAEERIMSRLAKAGRAEFFWDYQPWMLEPAESQNIHGAGYAVGQWVKKFPSPRGYKPPRAVPNDKQEVRLIRTTYPQSQASVVAAEILSGVTNPDATPEERKAASRRDYKRSAIVLTDEQMLLPILSVIPTDVVGNINITMGYDLRYTNLSGLARLMADLQSGLNNRRRDGKTVFNTKVVMSVLRHPYVVAADGIEATRMAIKSLIERNMSFVAQDDAVIACLALTTKIVRRVSPDEVTAYATGVFESVLSHFAHVEGASLDRETIWEALKVARRLTSVIEMVSDDIRDSRMLMGILCSMIDQQKVDFKGMPLGGLQLMGILETRGVDFDDVTILDMVEGKWPHSPNGTDTMIPMVIRRNNGMPTSDEQDSTYNYYFYRLKSRAKRLTMILPTSANATRPNIPSRYIMQMGMIHGQKIEEISAQGNITIRPMKEITVDKATIGDLMDRCRKLSPSSISNYLRCPLLFFFQNVAQMSVDDEITDEADNRLIGLIYHGVMERLYAKGNGEQGKVLTKEFLKSKSDNEAELDDLLMSEFAKHLKNDHLRTKEDLGGNNIIAFNILRQIVLQTLRSEKEGTVVVGTEMTIDDFYVTLCDGRKVKLKGTIDRQHYEPDGGGKLYVADYKTGKVDSMKIVTVDDLFDPDKHEKVKALTQVMTYCYMLRHGRGVEGEMVPYVLCVKDLHKADGGRGSRTATIGDSKDAQQLVYAGEVEKEFEKQLMRLIDEIFDVRVPFRQCKDEGICKNCDYRGVCGR